MDSDCAVPVFDIIPLLHALSYAIKNILKDILHKITRTTVKLVTAIGTLVLSVTPEPQLNTRSIVTFELIGRAVFSTRSSRSYHTHTQQQRLQPKKQNK